MAADALLQKKGVEAEIIFFFTMYLSILCKFAKIFLKNSRLFRMLFVFATEAHLFGSKFCMFDIFTFIRSYLLYI